MRAREFPSSTGWSTWKAKVGLMVVLSSFRHPLASPLASGEQSTALLITDHGEKERRLTCPPAPQRYGGDPGTPRHS